MENKNHYYDGLIYDKFIAPNQDAMFRIFKILIEKNSSVLDVGTGTGRLPFQLAEHCNYVAGIDLSLRNINFAEKKRRELKIENVEFIHGSILNIENYTDKHFDYAVTSYVLHEMPPQMRIDALKKMRSVADKIIIGDYLVPVPKGYAGWSVKIVEFLAGPDHFKNFRHYVKNGGIKGLAEQSGLKIIKSISNKLPYSEIAVLE